jgi:hypothetical protein
MNPFGGEQPFSRHESIGEGAALVLALVKEQLSSQHESVAGGAALVST